MSRPRRIVGSIAGVLLLVFVAIGVISAVNGKTVDPDNANQKIRTLFPPVQSVNCPDGVEVKKGKTFECPVVLKDGSKASVTVREVNDTPDITATLHR